MGDEKMALPPGFQFDPTDEELIVYFLYRRVESLPCYPNIIPDLDIHAANPWELNDDKAFRSKRNWYFFSSSRQKRCGAKGLWKDLGLSESIVASNGGEEVGRKNYLVFYGEEAGSKLVQTNWIMEEFHILLKNGFSHTSTTSHQGMDEWVLCRVHEANFDHDSDHQENINGDDGVELSYLDEVFFSMDDNDQEEISFP